MSYLDLLMYFVILLSSLTDILSDFDSIFQYLMIAGSCHFKLGLRISCILVEIC